jgi:hypothetical protein
MEPTFNNINFESNVETNNRYSSSLNLLKTEPIQDDPIPPDKTFIAGVVTRSLSETTITIDPPTPIATFENIKQDLRYSEILKDALTTTQLRKPLEQRAVEIPEFAELSLISAGCFLHVMLDGVSSLAVHKRSKFAPVENGSLTGPAGRCGEKPSETIINELNQEEMVIVKTADGPKIIGFVQDESGMASAIAEKLDQLAHGITFLQKEIAETDDDNDRNDLAILEQIYTKGENAIEIVNIAENVPKGSNPQQVKLISDGQILDSIDNCVTYKDEINNTLEIKQNIFLPSHYEIMFVRGGDYDNTEGHYYRRVEYITDAEIDSGLYKQNKDDISGRPIHPSLRHEIAEAEKKRQAHTDY